MPTTVKNTTLNIASQPIPPYYCCYLLRSSIRPGSLYIGSTPNPPRRLNQHNGHVKGGAKRTSGEKFRPWEMVILVEGFMSRVGALQFEWAWQNPGSSRHIVQQELELVHTSSTAPSQKPNRGNSTKKRRGLKNHLIDLHLLLRAAYFASWPLRIRFLAEDVYRTWQAWTDRIDAFLPDHIAVFLDANRSYDLDGCRIATHSKAAKGVSHIQVTYDNMMQQVEKAKFVLDESDVISCNVCKISLSFDNDLILVCPIERCRGASHMLCLAMDFSDGDLGPFVPHDGVCPSCRSTIPWAALVKELSLRLRGTDKIDNMFKSRKRKNEPSALATRGIPSTFGRQDDSVDDIDLEENWLDMVDTGSDDEESWKPPMKIPNSTSGHRVERVIEDSECDDAGIVD